MGIERGLHDALKPAGKYTLQEIYQLARRRKEAQMGMFDKDKEIGLILTNEFDRGEEFILHNATVDPEPVQTDIGDARKTRLIVSRKDTPGQQYEVTTLGSAIADKAEEAEEGDFPAVVKWLQVSGRFGNDATVLQFVRQCDRGSAA